MKKQVSNIHNLSMTQYQNLTVGPLAIEEKKSMNKQLKN